MFEDLYKSKFGRLIARALAAPFISYAAGVFMDSRLSRPFIKSFARKNNIDLSEAEQCDYKSFNAFFTRKLVNGARPVCMDDDALVSPCDGLLSVLDVNENSEFHIKNSVYDIKSLTEDGVLSDEFMSGKCLIFRLTPAHYHRYIWPCDGKILSHKEIKGIYHTVRPTAVENVQVFKTNTRQYSLCETERFGKVLVMEVGALLVGRIVNHKTAGAFCKGEEKGYFEFGGSTIVMFIQSGTAEILPELISDGEVPVRAGQRLNKFTD